MSEFTQMSVKERIKCFIKYKNISQRRFEESIGKSNGYLNNMGYMPNQRSLNNILEAYPELNRIWLLTGNGQMTCRTPRPSVEPENIDSNVVRATMVDTTAERKTKPVLPVSVSAGAIIGNAEGIMDFECERKPVISRFPDYDFTMYVRGDSMSPQFESGDEIACKKVEIVDWGNVYVLSTKDGAMLKKIYDSGDQIKCVSINSEYPEFFIDKESVDGVYKIVGMLRT